MIIVKNNDLNLGTIQFGRPYFFKYEIQNAFLEVLYIDQLLPGCHACTEATIDRQVLAPNEKAIIKIMFTPGDIGEQKKKITIINRTLGKRRPNVYLSFKATVQ